MPERIQRKRTKGWRMPENTVYVGRPSRWGNRYALSYTGRGGFTADGRMIELPKTPGNLVRWYESDLVLRIATDKEFLAPLRGKNLACWCPLDQPCHADVLLRLANQEAGTMLKERT